MYLSKYLLTDQVAVVTGGSGGTGEHIVKGLAEKGLKVVVLDVRTPKEFKEGHIPGATNIDFTTPDFEKRIGKLDKSKTYLVHCASGGRSRTRALVSSRKNLNSSSL